MLYKAIKCYRRRNIIYDLILGAFQSCHFRLLWKDLTDNTVRCVPRHLNLYGHKKCARPGWGRSTPGYPSLRGFWQLTAAGEVRIFFSLGTRRSPALHQMALHKLIWTWLVIKKKKLGGGCVWGRVGRWKWRLRYDHVLWHRTRETHMSKQDVWVNG